MWDSHIEPEACFLLAMLNWWSLSKVLDIGYGFGCLHIKYLLSSYYVSETLLQSQLHKSFKD